jgi:acetyl esterase/lipase
MDILQPDVARPHAPCVLFAFGGGFKEGYRTDPKHLSFLKALADSGYVVATIDYRLGMKGVHYQGPLQQASVFHKAVDMAVEDVYAATLFLLQNADAYGIDAQRLILCGSSAGAITALQAEWYLANRKPASTVLPTGFTYAGVVAFAGALLSFEGKPRYQTPPPPTLLFHGTKDKLVEYNRFQIFNIGIFGSSALAKIYQKKGYTYGIVRYKGLGHDACLTPMNRNRTEIFAFLRECVLRGNRRQSDCTLFDPSIQPADFDRWKPKQMYR